jgi:SAM-dependent methyltransferase
MSIKVPSGEQPLGEQSIGKQPISATDPAFVNRLEEQGRLEQDRQAQTIATLRMQEQYRDQYGMKRDPIYEDRLLWRAQTFRHLVHLLPGQTILELGCGRGLFTRQLLRVSRGENPITAVTFHATSRRPQNLPSHVELLNAASLPGPLAQRSFDYVVAIDLLDKRNCAWFLQNVHELLKPGGQVIFYESNPWNLMLNVRRTLAQMFGHKDPRRLLSRPALYELMSEVGFIRVFAVYNDFVYAPLTRTLIWILRNLSILLENLPGIQTLAGSILIHAQKSPRIVEGPKVSLFEHEQLRNAISVVIPCHNEEMNIEPLIRQLRDFYGEYIHEIIPVDDNSQDGTAEVLRRLASADPSIKPVFRTPPNGVGRAIADGYRIASGRYVLSMDCDFQHLLPELRDLFDASAAGYDVVIGSRFSRYSVLLNYPFQKIIANRVFHVIANIVLRRKFRDMTNNLKIMRREVVEHLQLSQPGFAVNAETGLRPLLMGYSVKEVPISWINRTPDMGTSSFRLMKVGGGYWQVLLQLCRQTFFGTRHLPRESTSRESRTVSPGPKQ